jgi:hypothetical protein
MEDRLSDTILKEDNPRTIAAKFGLIWFNGLRGEDLNVLKLFKHFSVHSEKQ